MTSYCWSTIYIPIKTFIRHASLNIKYGGNCLFYVFTTYVVASVLICLSIDKIKSSFKVLNRWTAWHFLVKKINNKHVADFNKQFTKINYIWDQLSFNSNIIPYIPCCFVYWSAILAWNVLQISYLFILTNIITKKYQYCVALYLCFIVRTNLFFFFFYKKSFWLFF